MPAGACVIRYEGARGVTWKVKYIDASDRQVKETLGAEKDGWTRKRAEAALRHRLSDVEREGYRKPQPVTFGSFASEWLESYPDAKGLKRSTRRGYEQIVDLHLRPAFGTLKLEEVTVDRIERYLAAKQREGLKPGTRNRTLNVLSLVMKAALRRRLIRENPVALVVRPKEPRRRWRIVSPAEVVAVEQAFEELIAEAKSDRDREDRQLSRVLFLTLMGTGIRRGEALGLHWRRVLLADPDGAVLRVEETWVRHAADTPKSQAGERTIALGPKLASELFDHRARSAFDGDDDRVFANPRTGNPFDLGRYSTILRLALARAGVSGSLRPCHDFRHSSITNAAAAGTPPEALMSRAGHSSYTTTRLYIDLAGERFREEADRLERRLWGGSGTKNRYQNADSSPYPETQEAVSPLS
jgi:integrase